MKTIEEIQSELRTLAHELEELKESRSAGEREIDFERLSIDGSHKPITPHPLENYDEYARKCYLTMLLTVARFDEDKLPVSLLFAHRLAFGMRYLIKGENLQEEYIAAQTLSYKQLDDLVEVFKGTDERLMLILECMLTAGMFDKGKKDAIDYIVQLSQLLELSKDDMVFLSNMAAVILTQDLNAYKCDVRNSYEIFNCYLNDVVFEMIIIHENKMVEYDKLLRNDSFFEWSASWAFKIECVHCSLLDNKIEYKCEYVNRCRDFLTNKIIVLKYADTNKMDELRNHFRKSSNYKSEFNDFISSNGVITLVQNVNKNFVLLVDTGKVIPNCPIGVEAHPLIPPSVIQKNFKEALNEYLNSLD